MFGRRTTITALAGMGPGTRGPRRPGRAWLQKLARDRLAQIADREAPARRSPGVDFDLAHARRRNPFHDLGKAFARAAHFGPVPD